MKILLKRSLLLFPLMMSLTLAEIETPATGIVMDFGAVDTLVALDKADVISAIPIRNLPAYLKEFKELNTINIQDGGGMKEPNLEVYAELKPEFIVISPRLAGKVEALSEYAPVLNFTAHPEDYYASASQNILALAKLVNAEDSANVSLNQLNAQLDEIKVTIAKSDKTALTMMHNAENLFASPESSYGKFIHNFLGIKNAVKEPMEGRQIIDVAYLNEIQPDIIFIIDRSAAIGQTPMNLESFQSEIISQVTLESGKEIEVIYLDPTLWYLSGNGLMSIELQAKEVVAGLE